MGAVQHGIISDKDRYRKDVRLVGLPHEAKRHFARRTRGRWTTCRCRTSISGQRFWHHRNVHARMPTS